MTGKPRGRPLGSKDWAKRRKRVAYLSQSGRTVFRLPPGVTVVKRKGAVAATTTTTATAATADPLIHQGGWNAEDSPPSPLSTTQDDDDWLGEGLPEFDQDTLDKLWDDNEAFGRSLGLIGEEEDDRQQVSMPPHPDEGPADDLKTPYQHSSVEQAGEWKANAVVVYQRPRVHHTSPRCPRATHGVAKGVRARVTRGVQKAWKLGTEGASLGGKMVSQLFRVSKRCLAGAIRGGIEALHNTGG